MDIDTGILLAILVFVAAEFFTMREWKGEIKEWKKGVNDKLEDIFKRLPPKATAGQSPITLTEFGKSISKELGAEAWAEKEVGENEIFFSLQRKPEYEIHRFCEDYVHKRKFRNTYMSQAKMMSCAYNHGTTISEVEDTLVVVLRDAVLELKRKPHGSHKYKATEQK